MKRILFTAPSLTVGGMEKALITLANRLCESGYSVTVMILDDITELGDTLDDRALLLHRPYKSHPGSRIPYIRHKLYDDGMWETRAGAEKLYQYYTDGEKYDVEIAFFRGLSVKIISGSTNKDAVHLAWVHSDFRQAKGYMNNFRDIKEVNRAYSRFDRVVCVSEQARQGFIETVGDTGNTLTVYNMLPAAEIRELSQKPAERSIRRAKLHLVIVARLLDRVKGQLRLISAVAKLRKEGESISLCIVGGGSDRDLLQKEIASKNAGSYIELVGEKKNPYPYIKEADALVCASYWEGYSLTVAEALILETPVISTDCAGPAEILDHGKYGMITENSDEALYEGIKRFCREPGLIDKYREKARERQSFFDEDKTFRQITNLFEG